ncbi:SDR family oxidoreductase [Schaalia sp. 19OD2882]|nr:SDR family oxidoreductase [Schaalia sp. 19OD2882]
MPPFLRPTVVPVRGAVVLVTGAGSGIGALVARGAAARGAKAVLLWDIDEDAANRVAADIVAAGVSARVWSVDVASTTSVKDAGAGVLEEFSRVDILVNCAGIVTGKYFDELNDTDVRRTFEVNTFSLYRCTRPFLPGMIARDKGSVVTIASAAGLVGVSRQTDYSASKFAAIGFTESLRSELRHRGSRVHTLVAAPYYVDTGMFDGVRTKIPALLPILDPRRVAEQVLDAVEKGQQRKVMPVFANAVMALKVLPVPVLDWITDLFGVSSTMDHFVGRKVKDPGRGLRATGR